MKQDIAFNQATAGNTHNMCLDNVRRGFGIANKYSSAWEAWEHTQQHTDPIPDGLDVPLFYSYTADIDGVTKNYGHINVRLANGTVWSDGTIYANLDAYLANHWPKYVGWGESVNDFKIIEGGDMPSTIGDTEARILIKNFYGYTNELDIESAVPGLVGQESNTAIRIVDAAPTHAAYLQDIASKEAQKPATGSLDAATKAEIDNTNSVVTQIFSFLQKIFIGSK